MAHDSEIVRTKKTQVGPRWAQQNKTLSNVQKHTESPLSKINTLSENNKTMRV